jgi:hypothetical protein
MKTLVRNTAVLFSLLILLAASSAAQDRWQIVRAEYGAGQQWADVTARVLSLVRGDALDFRVDNDTLGQDPAPDRRKGLRLQVRDSRGQIRQLSFSEKDSVHLAIANSYGGPGPGYGYQQGLQITSAQYGAEYRMTDVTSRIAGMVQGDRLSLRVAHDTIGVDPAEGRTKHIEVSYTFNGTPGQVSVKDGDTLDLPGAGNWNGGSSNGAYGTLTILRAEYGAGSEVFDVTSRLASQVQGNSLQLGVTNDNMGGDPAHDVPKQVNVWYLYNNRAAHVVVNEKDTLILPGTGDANYYQGRLQITRAQYGADYRFADVTSFLNSQVQNDSLNLQVTNDAMGGDPARGERKVLTVFYIYNGRQARAFANENDVLVLPVGTAQGGRGDRDDDDDSYYGRYWPGRSMSELRVLQASWGAGNQTQDLTGQLNGMVRGNRLDVAVNVGTMGGDPVPGALKRLRVIYIWRGLRYETNVPEGGSLTLP